MKNEDSDDEISIDKNPKKRVNQMMTKMMKIKLDLSLVSGTVINLKVIGPEQDL